VSSARPSFSIVLETENLAAAGAGALAGCLDALAQQELPVSEAREVLLAHGGDLPAEVHGLRDAYPWLTFYPVPPEAGYYEAKMAAVGHATGDVVVFCDSDCAYEPQWLARLLAPFAERGASVVAGETTTPAPGVYGAANALTYIFPRYSGRRDLYAGDSYFCNNVAFRRDLLERHPLPSRDDVFRGSCVSHARTLLADGVTIWRQPRARALHALPGPRHFAPRYLLLGHEALLLSRRRRRAGVAGRAADLVLAAAILGGRLRTAAVRARALAGEDAASLLRLPLAAPVALAATLLFAAGVALALVRPDAAAVRRARAALEG
jgi:glycosyltransferase involved in cell wall biosynthesis